MLLSTSYWNWASNLGLSPIHPLFHLEAKSLPWPSAEPNPTSALLLVSAPVLGPVFGVGPWAFLQPSQAATHTLLSSVPQLLTNIYHPIPASLTTSPLDQFITPYILRSPLQAAAFDASRLPPSQEGSLMHSEVAGATVLSNQLRNPSAFCNAHPPNWDHSCSRHCFFSLDHGLQAPTTHHPAHPTVPLSIPAETTFPPTCGLGHSSLPLELLLMLNDSVGHWSGLSFSTQQPLTNELRRNMAP